MNNVIELGIWKNGIVTGFSGRSGEGVIQGEDNRYYYFQATAIMGNLEAKMTDRVKFRLADSGRSCVLVNKIKILSIPKVRITNKPQNNPDVA